MGAPAEQVTGVPAVATIAGSDSGGGAGIQADLKVFFALGCHGTSAVTALTAQNTMGVEAIHEVPPDFVVAQIDAIASDIGVDAAKTGMLASAAIVEAVAERVEHHGVAHLVVDPVSVSKHGHRLLAEDAIGSLKTRLLPLAEVVTPNLAEAEVLAGHRIESIEDAARAARAIHSLGPRSVLVKGGHLDVTERAVDVFFDGDAMSQLDAPRFDTTDTHGTGCALSAAIAARLALGDDVLEAVNFAKDFVTGAIRYGLRLGHGFGPVNPGWRLDPAWRGE